MKFPDEQEIRFKLLTMSRSDLIETIIGLEIELFATNDLHKMELEQAQYSAEEKGYVEGHKDGKREQENWG